MPPPEHPVPTGAPDPSVLLEWALWTAGTIVTVGLIMGLLVLMSMSQKGYIWRDGDTDTVSTPASAPDRFGALMEARKKLIGTAVDVEWLDQQAKVAGFNVVKADGRVRYVPQDS